MLSWEEFRFHLKTSNTLPTATGFNCLNPKCVCLSLPPAPVQVPGNSRPIQFCSSTLSPILPERKRHLLTWPHIFQIHFRSTGQHFPFKCLFLLSRRTNAIYRLQGCMASRGGGCGSFSGGRGWGGREELKEINDRGGPWPKAGWMTLPQTLHTERRLACRKREKRRPTSPWKTFLGLTSFKQDKVLQSSRKRLLWLGSYQSSKLLS